MNQSNSVAQAKLNLVTMSWFKEHKSYGSLWFNFYGTFVSFLRLNFAMKKRPAQNFSCVIWVWNEMRKWIKEFHFWVTCSFNMPSFLATVNSLQLLGGKTITTIINKFISSTEHSSFLQGNDKTHKTTSHRALLILPPNGYKKTTVTVDMRPTAQIEQHYPPTTNLSQKNNQSNTKTQT